MEFIPLVLAASLLASMIAGPGPAHAAPVKVRYPEGSVHGYLALRSLDGKLLASGDLYQTMRGKQLTSHLVYRFRDGSIDDESAVFTQNGNFQLVSDHRVQKGPSFPKCLDMQIVVKTGEVKVLYTENGKSRLATSHIHLPDDLANGILLVLIKNLPSSGSETTISYLAATPKPRIVQISIKHDGSDAFTSAGLQNVAQRYRIHADLGGVAGFLAPLLGKEPADSLAWVSGRHVPAFIKSESPLYLGGPLLRTELVGPVWQAPAAQAAGR